MRSNRLSDWEKQLKKLLDAIDDVLEDKYGNRYKLHPVRAKRGKTSDKSQDGLFNITAVFSLGIGSEKGRGYVLNVRLSTLEAVDLELVEEINDQVMQKIHDLLPTYFPNRKLDVIKDGNVIKIFGDLSL